MATKKLTLAQEYRKELRRINRFIAGAEKRGYSFDYRLPTVPKRVTRKQLARLREIKPDYLYQRSTYKVPGSEEIISGAEARSQIRSRAAKKGLVTRALNKRAKEKVKYKLPSDVDAILANVEELVGGWQPKSNWKAGFVKLKNRDKNIVQSMLRGAIAQYGKEVVARNLERRADEFEELIWNVLYGYGASSYKLGSIEADTSALAAIIFGRSMTVSESKQITELTEG